jgi:lysophospholipase L1-like esterase
VNAERIALTLTATAGTLFAGEVLLRALELPRFDACEATAAYAVADPELGFRGAAGTEVAGVTLNQLGLRGPLPTQPKPVGVRRILFLGDSTCWGLGVALDESFAAAATAQIAAASTDQRFDFVLGAFPGYSSYHSALLLERLLPLEPDIVVLYVGARNDGSRARYYPDAEIPSRRARLTAGWHQLRILRGIEGLLDRSYRSFFRQLRPATARARVSPPAFRANLERIAQRLEEAGVPALVVLPPLSSSFATANPQSRIYRKILVEVAAEHALPTLSLDEAFAAADGSALFFEDDFHLTKRGHAIATAEIARAVLENPALR